MFESFIFLFLLRTIKGDAVEDYQMDSPAFEHDPIKVYLFNLHF